MNTSDENRERIKGLSAVALGVAFAVAGCATLPDSPTGSAEVRSKLTSLQSDERLASHAPVEIREAELALLTAEQPLGKDTSLAAHRVYMADRKVEIAIAKASTRYAESQREALSRQRAQTRLDARTNEADTARRQARMARDEAETALVAAAEAAENAEELRRQIDLLKAEATDRGLVLTLGDVLFATGRSDLQSGGTATLDKLVAFLNEYPDRTVSIEGHTDNVGSLAMNQTLSKNRALSVRTYLLQQGIQSGRLTASGMGETQPIADNLTESGRQQNRRVEVVIENPPAAISKAPTI